MRKKLATLRLYKTLTTNHLPVSLTKERSSTSFSRSCFQFFFDLASCFCRHVFSRLSSCLSLLVSLSFRFRDCMMQPPSHDDPSWELFTFLVLLHSSHFSFLAVAQVLPLDFFMSSISRVFVYESCSFTSLFYFLLFLFSLLPSSLLCPDPLMKYMRGNKIEKEQENTEKEEQSLEKPSQVAFCEREYNSIWDRERWKKQNLEENKSRVKNEG